MKALQAARTKALPHRPALRAGMEKAPERIDGLQRFIRYALEQPGVWFVTNQQLIEWMRNPVPASEVGAPRAILLYRTGAQAPHPIYGPRSCHDSAAAIQYVLSTLQAPNAAAPAPCSWTSPASGPTTWTPRSRSAPPACAPTLSPTVCTAAGRLASAAACASARAATAATAGTPRGAAQPPTAPPRAEGGGGMGVGWASPRPPSSEYEAAGAAPDRLHKRWFAHQRLVMMAEPSLMGTL